MSLSHSILHTHTLAQVNSSMVEFLNTYKNAKCKCRHFHLPACCRLAQEVQPSRHQMHRIATPKQWTKSDNWTPSLQMKMATLVHTFLTLQPPQPEKANKDRCYTKGGRYILLRPYHLSRGIIDRTISVR